MSQTFTAYKAGGRTRTVQNLGLTNGAPTPEAIAYTFTGTTAAPSSDTDGFKNVGLQKTLHLLVKNNNTGGNVSLRIWGYHSAFDEWGVITVLDVTDGSGSAIVITVADNIDLYNILNIEGIERIYVQCTAFASSNSATVWLGTNTI